MKPDTTPIWLIVEFEPNSGVHHTVAAYCKEENARSCVARMVGTGKYYSLRSMEVQDAE